MEILLLHTALSIFTEQVQPKTSTFPDLLLGSDNLDSGEIGDQHRLAEFPI